MKIGDEVSSFFLCALIYHFGIVNAALPPLDTWTTLLNEVAGNIYYRSSARITWDGAKTACENMTATLAKPTSADEISKIWDTLSLEAFQAGSGADLVWMALYHDASGQLIYCCGGSSDPVYDPFPPNYPDPYFHSKFTWIFAISPK